MHTTLSTFFISCLLLAACQQKQDASAAPPEAAPPSEQEIAHVQKTGKELSAKLVKSLGAQLKSAMASGGPVAAVEVCQNVAQSLTKSVGESTADATVRRTAIKVRNPENAPDETDLLILQKLADTPSGELPEEIIEWTPDTARYYKPLLMQEVCIKCHGDSESFSQPLQNLLKKSYPDDQATGYETGELRGVIRVDIERK